jgi:hypothetical protein
MNTAGGRCFGENFSLGYDDCVAIINPARIAFGPSQVIRASFFKQVGYASGSTHEAQLLLRANFGANTIDSYEVLATDGALQLMKWKGVVGGFAELPTDFAASLDIQTGDIMIAQVSGISPVVIEVYRDRGGTITHWHTTHDDGTINGAVIPTGQPGLAGFYRDDPALVIPNFCWESWEASDDPSDFHIP